MTAANALSNRPAPPRSPRRDYDRRKRRTQPRRGWRGLLRQPLLLGSAVLLLGIGGGTGWLAWSEGWLGTAQGRLDSASRWVVAAVTPFKLAEVTIDGRKYIEPEVVKTALDVTIGESLLGIDLQAARRRLEAIEWVADATVERRLPSAIHVSLKERHAVALWQNGNEYTLIDETGRAVRASSMPAGADQLLLLGGAAAPEHVVDLLLLLAYERSVARELRAAIWVGQRRWTLVLKNGVEIWLPEEDAVAALQRLVKLAAQYKLLGGEFGTVDLRLPDKLYLRRRAAGGEATPGPA